jgi:ABC-2 type transport system ATP-binding protein
VTAPTIATHGLRRTFPGGAGLAALDIEVARGEVLALLGPNGAGKTTTVRLLNGVLRPDAGSARVLGLDPATDGDAVRARTGVLTENAGLDDRLTAFENLWFAARLRGLAPGPARRRIDSMLEELGLAARRDQPVQGMSTGQRKRVALIRALVHEPEVLFLDEPTSGLDPSATREVLDMIARLASGGRTVVLCTHFLGEAGRLADRAAILDRGRLHAFGRPHELAASLWPGTGFTFDLGRPANPDILASLALSPGVLDVQPTPDGATLRIDERSRAPQLVATIVAQGVDVYSATLVPDTLEQVYFAIEARIAAGAPAAVQRLDDVEGHAA